LISDITEAYTVYMKQKGFKITSRHSNLSVVAIYLHKGCGIKDFEVDLPKRLFITYHNRDITKEEIKKILEHCTLRKKLFYLMMVETGARPRTIVKLKYWMIKKTLKLKRFR
jgi:integrase